MRVVIDTNVWVSGLLFGGLPRKVLDLIEEETIIPCFTPSTITELEQVLKRKEFSRQRALLPFGIDEFLALVKKYALIFNDVSFKNTLIEEDPSDDKFLVCAFISKSTFIISGDKHLLDLENFHNIPIVTPKKFLSHLKGQ